MRFHLETIGKEKLICSQPASKPANAAFELLVRKCLLKKNIAESCSSTSLQRKHLVKMNERSGYCGLFK